MYRLAKCYNSFISMSSLCFSWKTICCSTESACSKWMTEQAAWFVLENGVLGMITVGASDLPIAPEVLHRAISPSARSKNDVIADDGVCQNLLQLDE